MRIFALELNNDRKGPEVRKPYIEALLARLPEPDMVFLPELALCGYMASREIWQYADRDGQDTARWARDMAEKYNTCIGVGYLELENGDYYNRYLVADKHQVFGVVTKSEGEAAIFKRGDFGNLIKTPFGNIAVGICYDAKRRHLYENIQDEEVSLIVFPHGCPADPERAEEEIAGNDFFCGQYQSAFQVPVVYVNSVGALEYMPGVMGALMRKAGFAMNGRSKIYGGTKAISCPVREAVGIETELVPRRRVRDIPFSGEDLIPGNWLFRHLVLKPDVKWGIRVYETGKPGR